jgi:hypothetical protein
MSSILPPLRWGLYPFLNVYSFYVVYSHKPPIKYNSHFNFSSPYVPRDTTHPHIIMEFPSPFPFSSSYLHLHIPA